MTYPPQQPGPHGHQGSWGPAPGPFPPPPGPPAPLPPPQAPPWLIGDEHGFPSFEPEPTRSRTGIVVALVVMGLLLLGGGGLAVWALSGDEDRRDGGGGEARAVAEDYVAELEKTVNTEITDIDLSAMEGLTCSGDFERMDREIGDAQTAARSGSAPATQDGTMEVGMTDFRDTGEGASFTLTQTRDGERGPDMEMVVAREGGEWKVCGLYGSAGQAPGKAAQPSSGR